MGRWHFLAKRVESVKVQQKKKLLTPSKLVLKINLPAKRFNLSPVDLWAQAPGILFTWALFASNIKCSRVLQAIVWWINRIVNKHLRKLGLQYSNLIKRDEHEA